MRAAITKIGNSQGVRIPKILLDEAGLSGEVDIMAEKGAIIIKGLRAPRGGWDEKFKTLAAKDNEGMIDHDISLSSWDEEEWKW